MQWYCKCAYHSSLLLFYGNMVRVLTITLEQENNIFVLLNCYSLIGKLTFFMLLLTETWQIFNDLLQLNLFTPPSYEYLAKLQQKTEGS